MPAKLIGIWKHKSIWLCLLLIIVTVSAGMVYRNFFVLPYEQHEKTVYAMDTQITLTAYGTKGEEGLEAAEQEIYRLEKLLSATDEHSDIYAVNHSGGSAVPVADDTAEAVAFALAMADNTGGALEPTLYPVVRAWGFTTGQYRIPSDDELAGLLSLTDYKKVLVQKNAILLPDGMELDLGAVGKGFAGDKVISLLKEQGIRSALINLGGNVQALGTKPDGSNWRVGIKSPDSSDYLGIVNVADCAVVTSGAYERFFIGADGRKYGHIINPADGRPVNNGVLSVTIIAPQGRTADALSTAMFVRGKDEAIAYWQAHRDFEMILLTDEQRIYITEGIADSFERTGRYSGLKITVVH